MSKMIEISRYEAYKGSGVEWLGEIPEGWKLKKFKFVATVNKGKLPQKVVVSSNNLPPYLSMGYLRGGEADQFVLDASAFVIDAGEILLLWDGSNSGEFIKSRKGVISSTVALVKYFGIQKTFAWYLSHSIEIKLRSTTVGMGIPHVNGEELNNCLLAIPPEKEQASIANFLDKKTAQIDQAITIKQQQIERLKERKKILIQKAVTQGLNPNVPLRDSGVEWIGETPEHWEMATNRTLFSQRVEPGRDELPLLSVSIHSGVSSEEISADDNIRGRIKIEDKSKYNLVKPNDIVFNMMRAWQGAIGVVKVKGMVSPAYIVAAPKKPLCSAFFEYQYRCPDFIQQMDRYSKGITDFRKRLYWDGFKQLATIVPPLNEQNTIADYIEKSSSKINQAIILQQSQIEKLKEYKTTLINSAVTGKIKITATPPAGFVRSFNSADG